MGALARGARKRERRRQAALASGALALGMRGRAEAEPRQSRDGALGEMEKAAALI